MIELKHEIELGPKTSALLMVALSKALPQPHRSPAHVRFGVPYLVSANHSEQEGKAMAVKIPNDAIASVPLVVTDLAGNMLTASLPDGVTVTISDASVAGVATTTDGQWIKITPLASGPAEAIITYSDATHNLAATLEVEIVVPQAATAQFNESGLVLERNTASGSASSISGGAGSTTGGTGVTGGAGTTGGAASTTGGGQTPAA